MQPGVGQHHWQSQAGRLHPGTAASTAPPQVRVTTHCHAMHPTRLLLANPRCSQTLHRSRPLQPMLPSAQVSLIHSFHHGHSFHRPSRVSILGLPLDRLHLYHHPRAQSEAGSEYLHPPTRGTSLQLQRVEHPQAIRNQNLPTQDEERQIRGRSCLLHCHAMHLVHYLLTYHHQVWKNAPRHEACPSLPLEPQLLLHPPCGPGPGPGPGPSPGPGPGPSPSHGHCYDAHLHAMHLRGRQVCPQWIRLRVHPMTPPHPPLLLLLLLLVPGCPRTPDASPSPLPLSTTSL